MGRIFFTVFVFISSSLLSQYLLWNLRCVSFSASILVLALLVVNIMVVGFSCHVLPSSMSIRSLTTGDLYL